MPIVKTSWNDPSDADFSEDDLLYGKNAGPGASPPRPPRLLLAEEDDDLRSSIARRLRARGYEVDEAFSGFEAIALVARQAATYDIIIADLDLRGMNGLELVDELRSSPHPADSAMPVIVLGESLDGEAAREAERLRAVVMERTCDLEQLRLCADSLARTGSAQRPN